MEEVGEGENPSPPTAPASGPRPAEKRALSPWCRGPKLVGPSHSKAHMLLTASKADT